MSKTHTKAFAGLQQAALGCALAFSIGLAGSFSALADGELTLKNVTVDANKQLVVQFAAGQGAPQTPKIMEMPAPNHQLLIDFTGVSLDENSVPSGDQLTKQLIGNMPGLKAARVGVLANSETPTVRVALDLDADLVIKPSISALQDGAAVISLGEDYGGAAKAVQNTASAPTPGAAAGGSAPDAMADPAAAYEEYYRKFLAQKQLSSSQEAAKEWGPRKGTLAEAKSVKGLKIIGTPVDSPALKDISEDAAAAPAPGARKKAATPVVEQPAITEAPGDAAPAAETVVETKKAVVAEAPAAQEAMTAAEEAPVKQAAAPAPEAAPAKEETSAQAQPDMVAGGESAASPEPQKVASAAVPVDEAPARPARVLKKPVVKPGPADVETAPAESAAAAPAEASAAEPSAAETAATAPGAPVEGAETARHKASRLYNEAYKNHIKGHVAQAILQYKEAIKINPELGEAHSNLGLAYNQQHNYASALVEFHKALAINPRDAITYNGVGAALRAEHDMPAAIKNWETAVKIDPRLAVAHYNLGTAYEAENDYDRALVSYENAVKNDQRMGEAFFRMGIIMQKRHRLQDAKAHYNKAVSVAPDSDIAAEAKEKIAAIDKLSK